MGALKHSPGGCHCCTGNVTIGVSGCSGLAVAGASVTIKHLGTTVVTGTTNGSGNFTTTLAAGSYTVDVSCAPRFLGLVGHAFTVPVLGGGVGISLGPGAGYACGPCAYPLANVLHGTDTIRGTTPTLTYNGIWVSPCMTYNYTAHTWAAPACASVSGTSIVYKSSGANLNFDYSSHPLLLGCPIPSAPSCPQASWSASVTFGYGLIVTSCPPAAFLATDGGTVTLTE